jgi:hypothetical protein
METRSGIVTRRTPGDLTIIVVISDDARHNHSERHRRIWGINVPAFHWMGEIGSSNGKGAKRQGEIQLSPKPDPSITADYS